MTLFYANSSYKPLAEKLRPKTLDEVVGQAHLVGREGFLRKVIQSKKPLSILFWGPPGCGKTTLARLYAQAFDAEFIPFSPLFQGVADLKKIIHDQGAHPLLRKQIILCVDEIHRFNKGQQDAFLPLVESGQIILIGATTENPSFSLNNALLSRLRILTLNPLSCEELQTLIEKEENLPLTEHAKETLIAWSAGDARHLLNMLEAIKLAPQTPLLESGDLGNWVQKKAPLYDKKDEGHYNLISALHKSIRGSDPDASLYWLSRMMNGGEDRQFLTRRLIRIASEDIGLADPNALQIALNAQASYHHLGSPEGDLALAEATLYLALAPKSNALYTAFKQALHNAQESSHLPPPQTILNPQKYIYDHDTPECFSSQNYFPDNMERPQFYHPQEKGFERELKKRIDYFKTLRIKDLRKHEE